MRDCMVSHRLLLSLGLATALAGPALAQPHRLRHDSPKPSKVARHAVNSVPTVPRTLAGALAETYASEPSLLAERAKLRATDENVPAALSGWRPTVVLSGTAGYGNGLNRSFVNSPLLGSYWTKTPTERDIGTAQATITQPLYNGGSTQAKVNQAKSQVMAERAALIAQEQTSFLCTVQAFVGATTSQAQACPNNPSTAGVIAAQQTVELQKNNVQVLQRQLQATNDRFRVGEITRTDVAQAQAALASAQAQLETAQGQLRTARSNFEKAVGYMPPANLIAPQPLRLPVHSEKQAAALAAVNNPLVVQAEFNDAAAKDAVDVAFAKLLPQVSVQGQAFEEQNPGSRSNDVNGYQIVAQVSVPLYQGGVEYAAVRQAKQSRQQARRQLDYERRAAVQVAVDAWDAYAAARAATKSDRSAIRANEVALEGVEREAIVGSRTTLDVLNAQQALLQSRTTLVQDLANLVTASYQVAAAIGRLTARDLHLNVPLYNDMAYYNAVKNRWWGLGDYATSQPNR